MACPSDEIAREFRHSRNTVRKILKQAEPNPVPVNQGPASLRSWGRFQAVIDQILADDEDAPPKQRHTAAQVFRRLRDEHGYPGGYAQVQRYLLKHRRRIRKRLFLWAISRANASKPISATSTSISPTAAGSCRFWSRPGPTPTPPSCWRCPSSAPRRSSKAWSRPSSSSGRSPRKSGGTIPRPSPRLILSGRERQLQPRYAALASHYVFDPLFCMPARGNEKPDAEGTVKAVQKRFATPVPRVAES